MKKIKLAIVSTTISGEKGYLPFDRLAAKSKFSEVFFVVAGDTTSQPFNIKKFQCAAEHLSAKDQNRFAVSSLIGWKSQRRRNTAFLRALELHPDFILTIDDDNIPPSDYFDKWYYVLTKPAGKIAAQVKRTEPVPWHNYLATANGPVTMYPRGFPLTFLWQNATAVKKTKRVPAEKIGLWQGISLGDPDIDGRTRLVYPKHLPLKSIREKNYVLQNVWSPYNTQNTVLGPKLYPLALMWPFAERMDDIFASFMWQKVLFNNGMYVHVGDALNVQDRMAVHRAAARDVYRNDFIPEMQGYLHGHEVWAEINKIEEKDPVRFLQKVMQSKHPLIRNHKQYFAAHLRDIDRIYK